MKSRLLTVLLLALALVSAACTGDDDGSSGQPSPTDGGTGTGTAAPENQLAVAPASYDLAVGENQRFIAGVLTPDRQLIAHGEVTMRFFFLGKEDASGEAQERGTVTATFLPVPGMEPPADADQPTIVAEAQAAGVYEAAVTFDEAGFWGVQVSADVSDGSETATRTGTAAFQVAETHTVPGVGDPAPDVRQATVNSEIEFTAAEIDSRAVNEGSVPDPALHDATIEQLLADGTPFVLVVSTPVYCVSRFCGPITETIEGLAGEYGNKAEFVHLEVWENFEEEQLNGSAAAYISPNGQGGNEPWTFVVGPDGVITHRWDNVLDEAELREVLEGMPAR